MVDDSLKAQQAIDYYREQYDALGARLLQAQHALRAARRDAQRQRVIARIVRRLYMIASQEAPGSSADARLGDHLVALLVESLQIDCAALLIRRGLGGLSIDHGLGIHIDFQLLPALEALPARGIDSAAEQAPAPLVAALRAEGLQRWLWASSAAQDTLLLLGHRHERAIGSELTFEPADQDVAETVLGFYLALKEQRSAQTDLQRAKIDYRTLFESAQDAFVVIDGENLRLVDANHQAQELLGANLEMLEQRPLLGWVADSDPPAWRRRWLRALAGRMEQHECRLRNAHGEIFWVELRLIRIGDRRRGRVLLAGRDISKRKRVEERLRHYAFRDELTQLPNRALMYQRIEQALERQRKNPTQWFALLFLDLDRFKTVNDSLGHSLGDRLLVAIGQRLQGCLGKHDSIARLGGDEFLILLDRLLRPKVAQAMAQRLEDALSTPITVNGHEIFTSASIGIVLGNGRYSHPEAMLRDADIAMYQAKRQQSRERRFAIFDPAMHARALAEMELERDLRRALERNEFLLYYQPIVSLADARITGFEALVRWRHPERGLVPPDHFIPLAEDTMLILEIGRFVMGEACRQAVKWAERFPNPPKINVNLSGRQFVNSQVAEDTGQLVSEFACPTSLINLEITESAILTDTEQALAGLEKLHAQGFELSMDDFGTGYSSLSYLHQFPFDNIKIDRSFVEPLVREPRTAAIVTAIIRLAETLDKKVVAEGIETPEHLAVLQQLGCDYGQGYLFSRPVDASTAEQMLIESPW